MTFSTRATRSTTSTGPGDGKADPNALRQNQFGFTVGGPVQKNRTFYFGSVEVTSIHSMENRLVTVPTALERQGIFDTSEVVVRDSDHRRCLSGQHDPARAMGPVAARMVALWPGTELQRDDAGQLRVESTAGATARAVRCAGRSHVLDARPDVRARQLDGLRRRAQRARFRRRPSAAATMTSRATTTPPTTSLCRRHMCSAPRSCTKCAIGINSLRTNKQPLGRGFPNQDFGLDVVDGRSQSRVSRD